MDPEVRYCMTPDGVRIAYTVTGAGPPILCCAEPTTSHVQLEWSHPVLGPMMDAFARNNTLIRFDHRGFGLSDRRVAQTLDEWVLDIEAVVVRAGFHEFSVVAVQLGTPAALAFAGRHAEQVSRLVVLDGFARWSDFLSTPQVQAIQSAARLDFSTATEAIGFAAFGPGREESREHGSYIRACTSAEVFAAYDTYETWDASELARSITAPTLVLKRGGIHYATMEMAKDLAARIPNAQLAVVEGTWVDDMDGVARRIREFLNPAIEPAAATPVLPSGMTAILFADIVDSTALTERLGDAAFRAKARDLDAALRAVIRDHAGTPIEGKLLGDGVLAVFTSARQAIEAALACATAGADAGLPLHLGLHAGDVIREENNVYGGAVNIASRISGLSAAGEVLVSETVRSLARTSAGVRFEDRGEQSLKGVSEPMRVWAVMEAQ